MFLYLTKDLSAEIKEVLRCSPQWQLQENTTCVWQRGEDTIWVVHYGEVWAADEALITGPLSELYDGEYLVSRILREDENALQLFWAWVELPTSLKLTAVPAQLLVKLPIANTPMKPVEAVELEYCEPPF